MANQRVLQYPDPTLYQTSSPVEKFDDSLQQLVGDMVDTLEVQGGAGLAAPQIGIGQRVLIIRPDSFGVENPDPHVGNDKYVVMVNPSLTLGEETETWKEACLSVPSPPSLVTRSRKCQVTYHSPAGEEKSLDLAWPLSGAMQHEHDHLDGKLFIDRLSPVARDIVIRKMKKRHRHARIAIQRKLRRERLETMGPAGLRKKKKKRKKA